MPLVNHEDNPELHAGLPLAVDLDGTLTRTDILIESFLRLIKAQPWCLILVPLWLLRGKAVLKSEIAKRVDIEVSTLPYHERFMDFLRTQHGQGRALILATATHQKYADAIAQHLGFFSQVLATDSSRNMSGEIKRKALVELLGEKKFDYAGNDVPDLKVWPSAHRAVVVEPTRALVRELRRSNITVAETFADPSSTFKTWLRALRVHQWTKNFLIFVPLLAAHQFENAQILIQVLMAFLAMSLCASSVYLLNDLLDLEDDRLHPSKCRRPFAAGRLSALSGLLLAPCLLLTAFTLTAFISVHFLWVLLGYYVVTVLYSFRLKRVAILDVVILASLYTARLIAGSVAAEVEPSFWLLSFSMFIFLSLAILKRYTELIAMRDQGKTQAGGRGHQVDDAPILASLGTAAGYLSVLVMALYINHPEIYKLYTRPRYIWAVCPLILFWVSRVWLLAHRGQVNDDPIVFALRDRTSLAVAVLCGLVFVLAQ